MRRLVTAMVLFLCGCATTPPPGIEPVSDFDLERYLGRWYEIARLDHRFERGLSRVTADYSRRPDGGVRVVNRGYDAANGGWKEAVGRAFPVQGSDRGHFRVSFFGPFYGAYVIFELDHAGYDYALVCGPSRDYLWLLARRPRLEAPVRDRLLARAAAAGFAVDELIFVEQE